MIPKHFLLTLLGCCFCFNLSHGQQIEAELRCGTDDIRQELERQNPDLLDEKENYERAYQEAMIDLRKNPNSTRNSALYTIPTVVHIVYQGEALGTGPNLTDDRIATIIDETNLRFSHTQQNAPTFPNNTNYGPNTDIELCLATTDPSGNYTTGVVRHYDLANSSGSYNNVFAYYRDNYHWDNDLYYNMYIMTNMTNAVGVYIGGSFDATIYNGGNAFWSGLICHETGHYFSLAHTFDGCTNEDCLSDGDGVCDTPPKGVSGFNGASCNSPNDHCSTDENDTSVNNPYRPASDGGMGNQPDMLENYMDYTGGCWDAFTVGQKDRMHFNITSNRSSQTGNTAACDAQTPPVNNISPIQFFANNSNCSADFMPTIRLKNHGTASLTSCTITIEMNGSTVHTENWTGSLAAGAEADVVISNSLSLAVGSNVVKVSTSLPNGVVDGHTPDDDLYSSVNYAANGNTTPMSEDLNACAMPAFWSNSSWQFTSSSSNSSCQACAAYLVAFSNNPVAFNLDMPILDFSNLTNPSLTFKLGHIPRYNFIPNDELRIEVSANCGTPTVVYQKSGLNKATNNPPAYAGGAYLIANCNEFRTETVDLSAFSGMSQVEIKFIADGEWWSPIVLDDIAVTRTVLKVDLLDFDGEQVDENIHINWTTATEENNDYYQLERSYDGKNFEKIAQITGKRNSSTIEKYNFKDMQPQQGLNYYRLSQYDFDGNSTTFKTIAVPFDDHSIFTISPNPIENNMVNIHWNIPTKEALSIDIFNSNGQLVKSVQTDIEETQLQVSLQELPKGVYLSRISNATMQQVKRFVID